MFSVKRGEGEGWKDNYLGAERYFSYWSPEEIASLTKKTGFSISDTSSAEQESHSNSWIRIVADKEKTE